MGVSSQSSKLIIKKNVQKKISEDSKRERIATKGSRPQLQNIPWLKALTMTYQTLQTMLQQILLERICP